MGKVTGFLEQDRLDRGYKPVEERIVNFDEFVIPLGDDNVKDQAARCMDCGIPYCHSGCPVNNQIPDWNDLVYEEQWQEALINLHSTNNFPEFTGRICPAPCEESCTLNLENIPVTIKTIECAIVDKGWENDWIKPQKPKNKTGKSVGIIGAGPAGLAAAQQLTRAGHDVHVYEKSATAGGLLRYGIPDFKLDKQVVERRIYQMKVEGTVFHFGTHVGVSRPVSELSAKHDALLLAAGSEHPRDLPVEGRELGGVHFAMEFLTQQNKRIAGENTGEEISAKDKNVIVIGGGDTGSDCIGTSIRQGCKSVTQLEIMPAPPEQEDKLRVWPDWPIKMRTSSSQAEGAKRMFAVNTSRLEGENGVVTRLHGVEVGQGFKPVDGTEFELEADLVLLAMGFVNPVQEGMLEELGVQISDRKNVVANEMDYVTSKANVFAAGDCRRGQSLVVWAIREGRQAAHSIDKMLMGETLLPR